jgi:ribose transport system ATP-binding protein
MTVPLLQMSAIDKSFHGIRVLRDVSLNVPTGKTLGLIGENGAGKSTLMNILGGVVTADSGCMELEGQPYVPHSPRDAERAGVAFIHQELNLFPNLSVAENLFLVNFPRFAGGIDRRRMLQLAASLLHQVGLDVSPKTRVESLSAGERQLVEIAKALGQDARLIIFDEPTTSLTSRETDRLFDLLRTLQQRGIGMIYISHALGDVNQVCDELVILRDGQVVDHGSTSQFDYRQMVSRMVGRDTEHLFPHRNSRPSQEVLLEVAKITQPGIVQDVSFQLHRGEVLGISGLMGSGRSELARILFGLDPKSTGEIRLCGSRVDGLSTRQRVRRGLAMLTESRRLDGLCMQASIEENLALVAAQRYSHRFFGSIRKRSLKGAIKKIRSAVQLSAAVADHTPVCRLSGGNQQKVVIAKWLLNEPCVLILDEPTRGIDVGAKYEIYGLIDSLATGGDAVLIISSEIEELIGLCDRILVMSQGEIKDELHRLDFDRDRIMRASLKPDLVRVIAP